MEDRDKEDHMDDHKFRVKRYIIVYNFDLLSNKVRDDKAIGICVFHKVSLYYKAIHMKNSFDDME